MAETEKTLVEAGKEVMEATAPDAPKKNAVPAEPSPLKNDAEDLGAPVVKPTDSNPDATKKVKEVSGDAQQKGEGKPDKMDKAKEAGQNRPLAASYDPMDSFTDDEIRELCHSADHDCATFVEHPEFGKGKPIKESHAIPDENGYVAWYDVQF